MCWRNVIYQIRNCTLDCVRYLIINADATFRIRGLFSNANIVKLLPRIPVHMMSKVMSAAACIMIWFSLDHLTRTNIDWRKTMVKYSIVHCSLTIPIRLLRLCLELSLMMFFTSWSIPKRSVWFALFSNWKTKNKKPRTHKYILIFLARRADWMYNY